MQEGEIEMKIINLTPHDVVIISEGKEKKIYPKSGKMARVATNSVVVGEVDGVAIVSQKYGEVDGLPEPKAGTLYIVSMVVRLALPDREDLISPDTSPQSTIRDENGQIIGVRQFVR